MLVTHQVTIAALTGAAVASGEGVLIEGGEAGRYAIRARFSLGD